MLPMPHVTALPLIVCLCGIPSFAVWEMNKIVMAITILIGVVNTGFQLTGEFSSSMIIPCGSHHLGE